MHEQIKEHDKACSYSNLRSFRTCLVMRPDIILSGTGLFIEVRAILNGTPVIHNGLHPKNINRVSGIVYPEARMPMLKQYNS